MKCYFKNFNQLILLFACTIVCSPCHSSNLHTIEDHLKIDVVELPIIMDHLIDINLTEYVFLGDVINALNNVFRNDCISVSDELSSLKYAWIVNPNSILESINSNYKFIIPISILTI